MTTARIKCTECDNMILPQTAAANGGLCGQCAKVPESLRRATREFEDKLASGSWFTPSPEELNSARRPNEFGNLATKWDPEPEYYKDSEPRSLREIIHHAAAQPSGHVFLVSSGGARLSLSYNDSYGVCEYQNEDSGSYLYAYTADNLREQIARDRHLVQTCPCCGVGMLWYPSRFHMPRRLAFQVFSRLVLNDARDTRTHVDWLDCGDISYVRSGRG